MNDLCNMSKYVDVSLSRHWTSDRELDYKDNIFVGEDDRGYIVDTESKSFESERDIDPTAWEYIQENLDNLITGYTITLKV